MRRRSYAIASQWRPATSRNEVQSQRAPCNAHRMTTHEPLRAARLLIPAVILGAASRVVAQDVDPSSARAEANTAVAQGAFSPWSAAPSQEGVRATAWMLGGYDTAGESAEMRSLAEAKVRGPLALRAGVNYDGFAKATRPFIGARADLLKQAQSGLNLAAIAQFADAGFNTVPALELALALGRRFGPVVLAANAGYAQGLQEDERNASGGLSALVNLNQHQRLGFDSKFQIDLERDNDEPKDEPDWRLLARPLSTTTLAQTSISVGAGCSALQYRLEPTVHVGAIAYGALGVAF